MSLTLIILCRTLKRMDLLQERLVRARAAGGVFARSAAVPPWGLRLPGAIQLAVHAVLHGSAWLWVDGFGDAVELRPGDLALVRGGPDHCIAHQPGATCVLSEDFASLPAAEETAQPERTTVFVCGAYRFAGDIGQGLVDALPPLLSLPATIDDPAHTVVALLAREMLHEQPGRQTVLDRLLDVLVVFGLRAGLKRSDDPPPWFRAAADPRLAPALQGLHAEPERPWTVEDLAGLAHMSRATFARAFQQVLGQTPMKYLSDWRMALARDLLLNTDAAPEQIAGQTGYGSVYAFSTAFQRHHGQPPRRWQAAARSASVGAVAHGSPPPR